MHCIRRALSTLPSTEAELDALGPPRRYNPRDDMKQSLMVEQLLTLQSTHEAVAEVVSNDLDLDKLGLVTTEEKETLLRSLLALSGQASSLEELKESLPRMEILKQLAKVSSKLRSSKSSITYDFLENSETLHRYGSWSSITALMDRYRGCQELKLDFLSEAAAAISKTPIASLQVCQILRLLNAQPKNKNFTTLAAIIASNFPATSEEHFHLVLGTAINANDIELFEYCSNQLRLLNTEHRNHTFVNRVTHGCDTLPLSFYIRALDGLLQLEYSEQQIMTAIQNLFTGFVEQDGELRVRIFYDHKTIEVVQKAWSLMPLSLVDVLLKIGLKFENFSLLKICMTALEKKVAVNEISRKAYFNVLQKLEKLGTNDEMLKLIQGLK